MKRLRCVLMGGLAWLAGCVAGQEPPVWDLPDEKEVYEVRDMHDTYEYLLEKAVNCTQVIWLRIDSKLFSKKDIDNIFFLLPSYRIAGLKVYPVDESLYMVQPAYKSCVRMLHHLRGHRSIELSEREKTALSLAQKALDELGVQEMSRAEAARALHDWIVLHAAYDVENAHFNRTYGPDEYSPFDGKCLFLDGKGVCDSYVQAYWLLLQMSGIPCSMMSGYVPKYKEGHAWNLVQLGDHWAHVDTTFDDPVPDKPGQVVHVNFDKSDAQMRESRTWAQDMFPGTAQTGILSQKPKTFDTLDALVSWLKKTPLRDGSIVSVAELGLPTADAMQRVEQAAAAAGVALCAAHDPVYPQAMRLRHRP